MSEELKTCPATAVHVASIKGFQSIETTSAYERARPAYPTASLEKFADVIGLHYPLIAEQDVFRIVDVGAGTGKFTVSLSSFLESLRTSGKLTTKYELLAVEPVDGMRRQFMTSHPELASAMKAGSATSIPLPDASVNAVIAAQAFHWFATEEALKEIHRVLKPGGVLALIWNNRDTEVDWIGKLEREVIEPSYPDSVPRQQSKAWMKVFDNQKLFSALEHHASGIVQHINVETLWDRIASLSVVGDMDAEAKAELKKRMEELVATHPQTQGKASFDFPHVTDLFWVKKQSL